jgi:hypothetical protein
MKVGDLVRSAEPHTNFGKVARPTGIIYRRHKARKAWWVEWFAPSEFAGEKECMFDHWLEVLSESR